MSSEPSARVTTRKDRSDPLWFRFLNSKAGVTLISVLLGGIAGNFLVAQWQEGAKERERQKLLAERNLTEGMQQVEHAFGQAGAMINATENLAVIIGDSTWNPDRYNDNDPERASRIRAKSQEIVERFNSTITTWQTEREQISLMITYLLGGEDSDPGEEWHVVQSGVDTYLSCVKSCYNTAQKAPGTEASPCPCTAERDSAWVALRNFARKLPKAKTLIRP